MKAAYERHHESHPNYQQRHHSSSYPSSQPEGAGHQNSSRSQGKRQFHQMTVDQFTSSPFHEATNKRQRK